MTYDRNIWIRINGSSTNFHDNEGYGETTNTKQYSMRNVCHLRNNAFSCSDNSNEYSCHYHQSI